MADSEAEKSGPGGVSSAPAANNTTPATAPVALPPQPATAPEPEARIVEETVTRKAFVPAQTPPPTPAPVTSAAKPPAAAPVPTPPPPAAVPTPVAATPHNPTLDSDIAKILQEVKLPERRDQKGAADAKPTPPPQAPQPVPKAEEPVSATAVPPAAPKDVWKDTGSVSAVHTLKNDLQGVVRDQKMSLVHAVTLEEERKAKHADTAATTQRSKRTFGILFSVVLLLALGAVALGGVYIVTRGDSATPAVQTNSSLLFTESSVLLSLDNQSPGDLKRILGGARTSSPGTLGSITRIIPVMGSGDEASNRPATFKEFMSALGVRAPDELIRALGDDFFFGIHTVDKNAPILIVPVTSYDRAFAGMLAWESTMNADLTPAFTPVPVLRTDANGLPEKRTFQDLVMRNYDVRALKDDAGQIELYYSFPTKNILIIAESPYSFPEILSRLQASRRL